MKSYFHLSLIYPFLLRTDFKKVERSSTAKLARQEHRWLDSSSLEDFFKVFYASYDLEITSSNKQYPAIKLALQGRRLDLTHDFGFQGA